MDNFFEPPLIGACIFGQSGGPTAVINASAYGVIRTALDSDVITNVYGAAYGIKGVLNDELYDMAEEEDYELKLLLNTPSSELGSCRYKIADPEVDDTDYIRILEIFKKYDVRYFFYNGGNDSMDTCNKIDIWRRSAMSAGSWVFPKQLTMICLEPIIAPVMAEQQSLSQHHAWKSARIPTFIIRIWSLSLK
mgnify:CR=1 FL=1